MQDYIEEIIEQKQQTYDAIGLTCEDDEDFEDSEEL
jgi:hypothetical protein